jgi:hypothetical protein
MAALFLALGLISSCSYRFTNLHVQLSPDIRTLAVESIYDTSREVIPHEILWEALQRAFAADGHLKLVSQGNADALLRAHITSANVAPAGTAKLVEPKEDPKFNKKNIPSPDKFRVLPQAGEYTQEEAVSIAMNIEIINLRTRQVVFTKNYSGAEKFLSSRGEGLAQRKSHYLLYDEALNSDIKRIANNIATQVVRDFVVGR